MAQYQVQLSDLKRQLAELTTTLTSDHYKVQRLQAQIKELESNRDRERKNILSRIRIDYDSAKKREAQLEQDFKKQAQILAGQAEQIIDFNMLQREVDTNKKLYEQTLAQSKEAGLASAMRSSNARIVDPAPVPANPQSPNLPLNLALSVIGGLICGALFVVVRSALDARVQVPGSLGSQLNLRELGVIPSAAMFPELRSWPRLLSGVVSKRKGKTKEKAKEKTKDKTKEKSTSILTPAEDPKVKVIHDSLELITWTQKSSVMSEAFRSVMTSILFSSENGNQPQILVVTSPAPQEGKTTVTTNLAIALAEINHRVLLIDADMRLPRLHSIFDLPNSFGLSDALRDRRPVDEYLDEELIQKTHIPNLHLMLAGPARSNFSRLLYSSRMKDLLARFRGTFDTILLDSAPVLTVPDARILARAADAVVLVIRAHQTHQDSAFAAVRCFEEDGRRVLGTILNDWNPKRSPYGPYRGYGGYGSYGTYSYYEPNSSGHKMYGPVGEPEERRQR
jgi:capsular exopolysaccharide synthesis family protein